MTLRPASFAGFLAHDLRLSLRAFVALFGDWPKRRIVALLLAGVVGLHLLAWPVANWLGDLESGPDGDRFVAASAASGMLFILPWIVATTMTSVTRMLYQRGDLDLLFASPIPPRTVLGARGVALAVEAVASVALLLLPLADAQALAGRWHWLAIYPALLASGLFGAGVGLVLALLLFFVVGSRRARLVSQIAATFLGASFILSAQVVAVLPAGAQNWIYAALSGSSPQGSLFRRLATLPARAASGDPFALAAWIALAAAVFALAIAVCGGPFAVAALQSAGAPSGSTRANARSHFHAGLGPTLRRKEHRLLWRDPWLLSQMMLQALYTLPVGLLLWRSGGPVGTPAIAFAPTLVVITGQLAGSLAWVALSAEDAPEFVASAPVTRGEVERAKLAAVALPVAMVMTPALAALAYVSPWGGFAAVVCGLGAAVSAALLMLWRQAPAARGMVLRRHSQSKLVALVEHWLSLLWALTAGVAVVGSLVFLAPVVLVALTLWLVRPRKPKPNPAPAPALA